MSLDGFNASALLSELRVLALGSRLQKFSQLTEFDFLLHLRAPGRTDKLLISLHPDRSRFHLLFGQHPPAIVPSSFVMLCRKHIGGTRLEALHQSGAVPGQAGFDRKVEFIFSSEHKLVFEWAGRPSALILVRMGDEKERILGTFPPRGRFRTGQPYLQSAVALPQANQFEAQDLFQLAQASDPETDLRDFLRTRIAHWPPLWSKRMVGLTQAKTLSELEEAKFLQAWQKVVKPLDGDTQFRPGIDQGDLTFCAEEPEFETMHQAANARWLESSQAPGVSDFRSELLKRLKKSRDKAVRKLKKRRQDRKGAESAPQDQLRGDLLLAYASGLKRGAAKFDTQDWEGRPLTINLDPKLSPTENADKYYNKAKKKRRALGVLEEQISLAESEIEMWDELLFSAESSENRTDLEQVRKSIPTSQQKRKSKRVPEIHSSGPRRYRHQDFLILVGRNPTQNEKLTLKTAAKDDHWLHVRQGAGSHVLIRTAGAEPPKATIEAAAWLAATYSHAKASTAVEIVTTRARFVKKPKGGALGKVIYRQETEILANPTEPQPQGLEEDTGNNRV